MGGKPSWDNEASAWNRNYFKIIMGSIVIVHGRTIRTPEKETQVLFLSEGEDFLLEAAGGYFATSFVNFNSNAFSVYSFSGSQGCSTAHVWISNQAIAKLIDAPSH